MYFIFNAAFLYSKVDHDITEHFIWVTSGILNQ